MTDTQTLSIAVPLIILASTLIRIAFDIFLIRRGVEENIEDVKNELVKKIRDLTNI